MRSMLLGMHQGAWCTIDLGTMPDFQPWKPESLEEARAVQWRPVNAAALRVLAQHGPHADLLHEAKRSFTQLSEGLEKLLEQPIIATAAHITDGGHRIIAMLEQGERWTVGWAMAGDVSEQRSCAQEPGRVVDLARAHQHPRASGRH